MHWLYLFAAISFEVAGTTMMKLSQGFAKLIPSVLLWVFYFISFSLLTLALKKIPVSVAYAIWSGIGTVIIASIGIIFFKESINSLKIVSIAVIIIGVVGLNMSGISH